MVNPALAARLPGRPKTLAAIIGREDRSPISAAMTTRTGERSILLVLPATEPGAARLFRLLSLHPGPDSTACAAASLAGLPADRASDLLAELARAHLVTERSPGRFACHDLLRTYALEQARTHDTEDERRSALHRLLDHYQHSAHAASLRLRPLARPVTLPPATLGVLSEQPPGNAAACAWFEAGYPVLLAVINQAAVTGEDAHAWQLA